MATGEVTRLLDSWRLGDATALPKLVELVEPDLRKVALAYMRGERNGQSVEANVLVNEVYLRLARTEPFALTNRTHFFSVAAKIMRRILVDHARRRARRRGPPVSISISRVGSPVLPRTIDVIALETALDRLTTFDPQKANVVELRFFGGLNEDETAEVLGIPLRTVQRHWSLARAWLFRALQGPLSTAG